MIGAELCTNTGEVPELRLRPEGASEVSLGQARDSECRPRKKTLKHVVP